MLCRHVDLPDDRWIAGGSLEPRFELAPVVPADRDFVYTFHGISLVVDMFSGKNDVPQDAIGTIAFCSDVPLPDLFPQLIAGRS